MKPKEINEDMIQIFGEDSLLYATVKMWAAEFSQDEESTEDDPQSGHPKTSTTDERVHAIHCMVLDDRYLTARQRAKSIGINSGSFQIVLTEILEMGKLSGR